MSGSPARTDGVETLPRRSVILDAAGSAIAQFLTREGFALAEPVRARFRASQRGSTGVAVFIRLADPARAGAAKATLMARFGGAPDVDVITVA